MPSRTYNMTVNHRRQILSSTFGHPARWNDKTLQLYDSFVTGIQQGTKLDDVTFELVEADKDGNIVFVKYEGAWLIVDNGYLRWPTTVPTFKESAEYKEIRFSQWLESMRKDVECTFGILKGRFIILKTGVRLHGIEATDRIWMTCCALHNMLLDADGLSGEWENGVPSDWEGELGEHNSSLVFDTLPFAVRRLAVTDSELRRYDSSAMGRGTDYDPTVGDESDNHDVQPDPVDRHQVRLVRHLSIDFFRGRLVKHFDILFKQGKIHWPSRTGILAPSLTIT